MWNDSQTPSSPSSLKGTKNIKFVALEHSAILFNIPLTRLIKEIDEQRKLETWQHYFIARIQNLFGKEKGIWSGIRNEKSSTFLKNYYFSSQKVIIILMDTGNGKEDGGVYRTHHIPSQFLSNETPQLFSTVFFLCSTFGILFSLFINLVFAYLFYTVFDVHLYVWLRCSDLFEIIL